MYFFCILYNVLLPGQLSERKIIAKINMPPAVSKADEYIATEWRMKI